MKALTGAVLAIAALGIVAAAPRASLADDARIALIPGGPHPYFTTWEDGAKAAMADFGVAAADFKVPAKWELATQNQLVETLASQGYNGFLIFPGDPNGSRSVIGELADMDIPEVDLAGCTQDPTPALFCLGTDTGRAAYLATKALIEALGGHGRIAHFTGFLVDPNTKLRMDGVEQAVAETNGQVELIQTIADIDAPEPAQDKINAFLAGRGTEVDGIVTTAWVPAVVAADSLRTIGDRRIKMIAEDHDPVVLQAVKDGYVTATMLQNPYGQGYIGTFAMSRLLQGCTVKADAPFLATPQTPRFIDTGNVLVGPDEVDNYVDRMRDVTTTIMADFETKYLDCP